MRGYTFIAILGILTSASSGQAQNLITNHSFESPAFDPGYPPLLADGWYSDHPTNMYIGDSAFATDGSQYQQTGGSLEQNTGVAVTPGATYRLEFDYVSFTDDPSGPPFAQLYTNPNADNDALDPGNMELFSQALPTGPTSTILPQSFDIKAPESATGFLHLRFLTGHNYRGLDNVRLTILPAPTENADFDGDGDVDGNDFLIWQRGIGLASPTQMQGDSDGDEDVDGDDLGVWITQFGSPAAAASASAIPEPTSNALLLLAVAFALSVARSRA